MRVVSISDVHGKYRYIQNIPDGDLIVCAGDITMRGELDVLKDFALWFGKLPHLNKVAIAGNHEVGCSQMPKNAKVRQFFADNNIHYLEDSGVEIMGYKLWGSPITRFFHNWEWNRHPGKDIKFHWDKILDNTNLLITHGPPFQILDEVVRFQLGDYSEIENTGCVDLLKRIGELKELKAHIFGHIHQHYGQLIKDDVQYVNASTCNSRYEPINPPIVIDI